MSGEEPESNKSLEQEENANKPDAETVALTVGESGEEKKDEAPPTYAGEAPPPYKASNIGGVIRRAKDESTGKIDFGRRVCIAIFCGVACCSINIILWLAIPIAMIVIGALYLKQCPRQHYIPIYLIVGGAFGVLRSIINMVDVVRNKKKSLDERVNETKRPNYLDSIITCFLLAWFIAGCYWVYSIHQDYQADDPDEDKYCHQVVYLFAFWLLTVSFILMALALLFCCGLCLAMCCVHKKQASYDLT